MEVDGPDRLSWARRRSPDSQRGPETAGLAGLRDNATSGPPSARLAALRGIKPGRVAPAPPSPDGRAHIQRARTAERAYDEAGASRAQQHDRTPAS